MQAHLHCWRCGVWGPTAVESRDSIGEVEADGQLHETKQQQARRRNG